VPNTKLFRKANSEAIATVLAKISEWPLHPCALPSAPYLCAYPVSGRWRLWVLWGAISSPLFFSPSFPFPLPHLPSGSPGQDPDLAAGRTQNSWCSRS